MARSNGTGVEAAAQAALTDDPDFLRAIVERTVQEILETEMAAHLGATRYERSAGRKGQRNGYRPRTLHTRVGTPTRVVPQDREAPAPRRASRATSATRRRAAWR